MKTKLALILLLALPSGLMAQGRISDYRRAEGLAEQYRNKTYYDQVNASWIDSTSLLWYSVNTHRGTEYFLADAEKPHKAPAFDQEKLAEALAGETGSEVKAFSLPVRGIEFSKDAKTLTFTSGRSKYQCNLETYSIEKLEDLPERDRGRGYWGQSRDELGNEPVVSPDSLLEAFIKDYDVWLRERKYREEYRLSWDGSEGEYYSSYMYWSPDSKKLIANKFTPGYTRLVHYVKSSPEDQLQPEHSTVEYTKPGDKLPHRKPALFLVDGKKQILVPDDLYPDQFSLGNFEWRKDSRAVTFEYNQRGHQAYRLIEIDANNGIPRVIIDEQCESFFHYSGKK